MKKNVTFKNRAINMAGKIFFPKEFNGNKKNAAIVCVHPGSSGKEKKNDKDLPIMGAVSR